MTHLKSKTCHYLSIMITCTGILTLSTTLAYADWVSTNGPVGGDVRAFTVDEGRIFAATYCGGIFCSSDRGTSWKPVSAGLSKSPTNAMNDFCMASVGGTLIAGTIGAGAFRSTDHGSTWTPADSGLKSGIIYCLAVEGDTVYAGDHLCHVYQSVDKGRFWKIINAGVTTSLIQSLLVHNGTLYAGTYGNGLCISGNNGQTWTKIDSLFTYRIITAMAAHDSTVFVGISSDISNPGAIYRSVDNGAHWVKFDSGIGSRKSIRAFTVDSNAVWVVTEDGIYRSIDDGNTWISSGSGLDNKQGLSLLADKGTLYAGTLGGVFVSKDHGVSWQKSNDGLTATSVNALILRNKIVLAGCESGVFSYEPAGHTWKEFGTGTITGTISTLLPYGNSLYSATSSTIYLLENDTSTWKSVYPGNGDFRCLALRDSVVFAGSYGKGVVTSSDGGKHWNVPATSGITSDDEVLSMTVSANAIFAGVNNHGIFKSDTAVGVKWNKLTNGISENATAYTFTQCGGFLFAGTNLGIYRSPDNGATWNKVNSGLKYSYIKCLAADSNVIFTSTDSGVFVSGNYGDSWQNVTGGLGNTKIQSLVAMDGSLFAGSYGGGVWQRPLSEMTVAVKRHGGLSSAGSELISICTSAKPNSNFSVSFFNQRSSHVTLNVLDLMGKEQVVLVDGFLGPGKHTHQWSTKILAPGCHIIKIQIGETNHYARIFVAR